MKNKELVELFPECEYIHKKDIVELVDKCFLEANRYQEIYNIVYDFCHKLYPEPDYDTDQENWKIHNNYFYGNYDKQTKEYKNLFNDWIDYIEIEYRIRNPSTRTYDEACKIVADKWCELLFNWHLQDNGAINENHGGGFPACALATILGNNAKEKISEENKKLAHEFIYEFYKNDCLFEFKDGHTWKTDLSVDYHPNTPLYKILQKAKIEEKYIDSICPWKTSIGIDKKDCSVVYRTYGKKEYL